MEKHILNKYLYWLIQLTWGILTTVTGLVATLALKLVGRPSYKNGYGLITTVGRNWGGLSLGPFAFCGRYNEQDGGCYNPHWYEHTRRHEFGHSVQVLLLGPLHIFVVGIPSAIRYWYRLLKYDRQHKKAPREYDDIWFEGTATRWGTAWVDQIEQKPEA